MFTSALVRARFAARHAIRKVERTRNMSSQTSVEEEIGTVASDARRDGRSMRANRERLAVTLDDEWSSIGGERTPNATTRRWTDDECETNQRK